MRLNYREYKTKTPPRLESRSFLNNEKPVCKISLSKVKLESNVSVQQKIEALEEYTKSAKRYYEYSTNMQTLTHISEVEKHWPNQEILADWMKGQVDDTAGSKL